MNWARRNYGWVIVVTVTTMLTIASGARFLYGVVLKDMSDQFQWTRSEMTVAVLLNMITLSVLQPFVGVATDRFGPKRVLVWGSLLLGLALLPFAYVSTLWQVYLVQGLLLPFGIAAVSPVNVTGLVTRWFQEKRGTAMSIATSGAAFGQLLIVPLAAFTLTRTDWGTTYRVIGLMILFIVVPLGLLLLRDSPSRVDGGDAGSGANAAAAPADAQIHWSLREALHSSVFWQLAFGFFVCGFTMAFASTHFMSYADDMGMAKVDAANVISVTAVFSILGSIGLGILADRLGRPQVLAMVYLLRGIAFFVLMAVGTDSWIFIYAAILGISWTATTPLTAAISADIYGRTNIGVIFGSLFTWMNIGFGAGSFLDGVIFDVAGGYTIALGVNGALGVMAALMMLQVRPAQWIRFAVPAAPSAAPAD
jgi:MFS family permease